jgi:hypothetical protein
LYRLIEGHHEVFFSNCSTLDALRLADPAAPVSITNLEATYYQEKPWVDEKDIPELPTVGDVIRFFETEPFVDLINFTAAITGLGELSSHDDMECSYVVESREAVSSIVHELLSSPLNEAVLVALWENPDRYVQVGESGILTIFDTFDDYLNEKRKHNKALQRTPE